MSFITKKLEEFELKLHNVYATVFQLSGYDKNQLEEKSKIMSDFLSTALDEIIKEVENIVDKKISIHSELEQQWTGMTVSGFIESINPHTERKIELLNIKQSLSSLREGNK